MKITALKDIPAKKIIITVITCVLVLFGIYTIRQVRGTKWVYVLEVLSPYNEIKNAIPYWVANFIAIGDTDGGILANPNAIVLDKETYEGGGLGTHTVLTLKVRSVRDSLGSLTYKGQPLTLNNWMDTKFTRVHQGGYVIYIGDNPPDTTRYNLTVKAKKLSEEPFVVDSLVVGSEMRNSKGEVLVKIVEVSSTYSQQISPTQVRRLDELKKDVYLTLELSARKYDSIYYYREFQKVKPAEKIDLFFREATLWEATIVSVEVPEEVNKSIQS